MKNVASLVSGWLLVLVGASTGTFAETSPMAAVLEAARGDEPPPFHLIVHRTDENGQRSLELFPSGVAVWKHRTQNTLSPAARASLLEILREQKFAELAPSYGGKGKPGLEGAALRITCRVALELDGLEKTSVQQADGEQSAELAALADELLDRVEPLAADGVTADDLEDWLSKLAGGELAAEILRLRFVRLPDKGDGEILSMRDGLESRKAYAPGRHIGDESVSKITSDRLAAVVKVLLAADVASLPLNLWSAEHVELEVSVFDYRTTVIGRDFSRLASDKESDAGKRFARLVAFLHE